MNKKPQPKRVFERKKDAVLEQVSMREDGQWFCRIMALFGDRQIKTWHKIEPPNLTLFNATGSRAGLPKDEKAA
jgi:hypothetical protein